MTTINYLQSALDSISSDDAHSQSYGALVARPEFQMFGWSDARWLEEYDEYAKDGATMLEFVAWASEELLQYPLLHWESVLRLLAIAYDLARTGHEHLPTANEVIGGWALGDDGTRMAVEDLTYQLVTVFETRWPDGDISPGDG